MTTKTLPWHILHLDDDDQTYETVAAALAEQGWTSSHAATLDTGLHEARTEKYDLLIIDRTLPEGDGLKMLGQLRQDGITCPAIILSAMGDVDNRVQGLTSGADDYLPKPFSTAELVARITNLMNRNNNRSGMILRAGELELDLEKHRMVRGAREEVLLPRESRLLAYLMRNSDIPLTRAMLLRDVWNFNLSSETNVIDVHMGKLRKKIDMPGESPLIRTVKGVGFMLVTT